MVPEANGISRAFLATYLQEIMWNLYTVVLTTSWFLLEGPEDASTSNGW